MAAALLATGLAYQTGVIGGEDELDWTPAPHMPHRRSYTASAELGGRIYVAGGMVGETGRPLDLHERFNPVRNEWTSLEPLPEAFRAAAGAAFQGRFWVLGGNSLDVRGDQVYSYDPRSRRWREETPLPAIRTNHTAVSLGGKLYAIGGLDPFHPTTTAFVYDPADRRWSEAAPLPVALHAHGSTVYRGEIWVIGGRVRAGAIQRRVWIYNPGENRWRPGPPLPEPMETLGVATKDDRIYAVLHSTYLMFDGSEWDRGPAMTVSRHALAAHAIGDTLYAVGGCIYPVLRDSSVMEQIRLT